MSDADRDVALGAQIVQAVEVSRPDLVRLATAVSLASRIEPALLRRIRLTLLPELHVETEAELWFSPLVRSYSPRALLLHPGVAVVLRERLKQDQHQFRAARAILAELHADAAPTIRLEEDVRYAALADEPSEEVDVQLGRALNTIKLEPGRAERIARWAIGAWPFLPERARNGAMAGRLIATSRVRLRREVTIGVQLDSRGLVVSEPAAATSHAIDVPAGGPGEPVEIRVRSADSEEPPEPIVVERAAVKRHRIAKLAPAAPNLEIETADGRRFRLRRAYDAIVVGSGFGGGVTACRLAEQGLSVCVLERGRRFWPGDFPDRTEQVPLALWHPTLNPRGMFDLRLMKDLAVMTAAGVGGGSLVYANVQLRAPNSVFEESSWPEAITSAELSPYYDRTEEALEPVPMPPTGNGALPKLRAFNAIAGQTGRTSEPLPLAIHFGEVRRHPFSGVLQQGCQNLGRCTLGCPLVAKNTVDITYIARAEAYGAEVFPMHEVLRVEPSDQSAGGWRVGFRDLQYRINGSVEAPLLVLAGGTIGTGRLLLKNRGRLPRLSAALGSRFSTNGDAVGLAVDPEAPGVTGPRAEYGPTVTSGIDYGPTFTSEIDYGGDRDVMVTDGGLPATLDGLLGAARGENALTGWRRVALHVMNARTRLGVTDRSVTHTRVKLRQASIGDSLVFLMTGRDAANGRMRLTPLSRTLDIRWNKGDSAELFDRMRQVAGELADAAHAKSFFSLANGPLGKFITVHPLGGCPMSDDPAEGVTDDTGKVYGYDGLYISDGSIIPTALGVSPSKTIAALAERNVEQMLSDRGPSGQRSASTGRRKVPRQERTEVA